MLPPVSWLVAPARSVGAERAGTRNELPLPRAPCPLPGDGADNEAPIDRAKIIGGHAARRIAALGRQGRCRCWCRNCVEDKAHRVL